MGIIAIGVISFIIICNPKFDKNIITGDILMWYSTLNGERTSIVIFPLLRK